MKHQQPFTRHQNPCPAVDKGFCVIDDAQLMHSVIVASSSVKAVHTSDSAVRGGCFSSQYTATPHVNADPYSPTIWQECLCLVEKRETRYRVQWYYRLFEETQRGLTRAPSLDAVHGSLLALGELLRHTGATCKIFIRRGLIRRGSRSYGYPDPRALPGSRLRQPAGAGGAAAAHRYAMWI